MYIHKHILASTRSNVFMTKDMIAKVADFGMCTNVPTATDGCGTMQWAAPEVLMNIFGKMQQYDKRCDVYRYVMRLCMCVCVSGM